MNCEESVGYKGVARKNMTFWSQIHLQDPARFVFADEIGLIVNQRMAISTVRRISWEIHRNLVNARDNLVKARKSPESLRQSVVTFKDALIASTDVQTLLDEDFLTEICCAIDANDPIFEEPKVFEKFCEGFRRLARKHLLSIGSKSVEMLAKRFMAFLKEIVSHVLYFKKVHINFSNIPKPVDFYRDQISKKVCYFDVQCMLRRLERNECRANMVLEMIHCRTEHLVDFVFDFQFQRMFSAEFKRFFDKWILGFKDRLVSLNTDKPKCLKAIPIHEPLLADQIPQFLHSTLISLFNDSRMSIFADGWADYVLGMIYQLPFEELEENKQENTFEWQCVLLANSPICDRLSSVYRSQNVEEQRTVLAHLLRFLLRFTSDLIRFVFNVKISGEGRIEKIHYDGHYEKIGEDGDVVLDEMISTSSHLSRHHIRNSHDKVITWLATSSRSRSPVRRIPTKTIMRSIVTMEEAKLPMGELSHSVLEKMGEMNKIRNWNSTLSPVLVTAGGGSMNTQLSETLPLAFPTPPPTPDSTLPLFDGSFPFSSDSLLMRGRQMYSNQQLRRRQTPKGYQRVPTPFASSADEDSDSDYEDFLVTDNNSNKPELGYFRVQEDNLDPYVLLHYPLIATAPDNNSNE